MANNNFNNHTTPPRPEAGRTAPPNTLVRPTRTHTGLVDPLALPVQDRPAPGALAAALPEHAFQAGMFRQPPAETVGLYPGQNIEVNPANPAIHQAVTRATNRRHLPAQNPTIRKP